MLQDKPRMNGEILLASRHISAVADNILHVDAANQPSVHLSHHQRQLLPPQQPTDVITPRNAGANNVHELG